MIGITLFHRRGKPCDCVINTPTYDFVIRVSWIDQVPIDDSYNLIPSLIRDDNPLINLISKECLLIAYRPVLHIGRETPSCDGNGRVLVNGLVDLVILDPHYNGCRHMRDE